MQKIKSYNLILIGFLVILTLSSCAQKPRSIIPAQKTEIKKIIPKIRRLELPSVYGLKVSRDGCDTILSWDAIDEAKIKSKPNLKLIGYNVYRFRNDGFLKNSSLNKEVIKTIEFVDKNPRSDLIFFYGVKALFEFENKVIEGPASQILSIK